MDPNATLNMILDRAAVVLESSDDDDARELAEHVEALHEWITRGGFLPRQWDKR